MVHKSELQVYLHNIYKYYFGQFEIRPDPEIFSRVLATDFKARIYNIPRYLTVNHMNRPTNKYKYKR